MEIPREPGAPGPQGPPGEIRGLLGSMLPTYLRAHQIGGFLYDVGARRVFLTESAEAAFDFAPGEFDGRRTALEDRVLTEDLPDMLDTVAGARAAGSGHGAYFRIRTRSGAERWLHGQASFERDADGRTVRAVGLVRNADAELGHAARQAVLASERRRQTDVIQAISAALAQVLTVDDLLGYITGRPFLDVVGASGVVLRVLDQDRRRLLAATGLPAPLLQDLGAARLDSELPISEAIRSQAAMFITREEVRDRYPLLWPSIEPTDVTSTAVIPLAAQGRPTGALSILYEGKRIFSPEERNLLLSLGSPFSQSLQRALLYDREHAMSVGLQEAMLPRRLPHVPGLRLTARYQPAREHHVGGDWYDVIPLPDGRIALVVGDVQGHDVQSAAVMGQLRAALRAYAAEGHSPSLIMARASAYLQDMETDLLATCACVHLDPETGAAQLVRAGHHCPFIGSADRRGIRVEAPGGLPLGLVKDEVEEDYPVTDLSLRPGETLMLFTDGLLESRVLDQDRGEHQLLALLENGPDDVEELADRIVSAVEQGQVDDIALLLARRESA